MFFGRANILKQSFLLFFYDAAALGHSNGVFVLGSMGLSVLGIQPRSCQGRRVFMYPTGCCNKTPQANQLIHSGNELLVVLQESEVNLSEDQLNYNLRCL